MSSLTAPHPVLGTPVDYEPAGSEATIYIAGGCFWGLERIFWELPGVVATSVGYTGGTWDSPGYVEVCTGQTGHAEAVRVVYDRDRISDEQVLATFWENHDPTQLNRQGNDVGTQYRSALWTADEAQHEAALAVRDAYQQRLTDAGHGRITTTVEPFGQDQTYWPAEEYHQAYLWKNPAGYCNHGFNGVACPTGLGA